MIDFDLGNALLPTMCWEEFQATDTYRLLTAHPEDCSLLCNLFSADSLQEMEFASNPRRGFHTMYEQEDFSEIIAFLRNNGKSVRLPKALSNSVRRCVSVFDTNVGRFAICRTSSRKITGILNKK